MPHNLRSTELGVLQRSKHVETAVSTSFRVAKKRLCVARRRASFQTRSMGGQLRTVRRQKQHGEHGAICSKYGLEQDRVVVSGIVQRQHHARAVGAMPQQPLQNGLERDRVERGAQGADECAGPQTDSPEARDRLAGGRREQDRILDLGRHPHAAPGAMLLEMAFVHAPEFNASAPGQAVQFF
jgi:hypothetical protein